MSAAERRWLELSVPVPGDPERAALLAEGLLALGGRAVEEREGRLLTHLEEPAEGVEAFAGRARRALAEAVGDAVPDLALRLQDHEDWSVAWRRGLDTRRITERIVVTPSWIPYEAGPGEVVLRLDPGMAFGTAEHGTTRGCLRLLDRVVRPGDRLLDVGSGSGILALAAAALGAAEVVAIEGDPIACEVLEENVSAHAPGVVRPLAAWADAALLEGLAPRDGIVANLETGLLRPLLTGFARALEPGTWLIVSGILAAEWSRLRDEVEAAGFEVRSVDEDGDWRSAWLERTAREAARGGGAGG